MIEDINPPDVVAEVRDAFTRYNAAIETGDTDALNAFFWNSEHTARFGIGEHLFGFSEIAAFRTGTWKAGPPRKLDRLAITALGRDVAATSALFKSATGKITRQTQTWARFAEGWRIVAAHVSLLPD